MIPEQLCEHAFALHRAGHMAEAEPLYLEALAAAPELFAANYLLGMVRYQQGRSDEAVTLLRAALQADPGAVQAGVMYGLAVQALGKHEEALASFDSVLSMAPDMFEAHFNRAEVLTELKRFSEAIAAYGSALKIKPGFAIALYNRGNALRAMGRLEEALHDFDAAMAASPNFRDACSNRASILRELGRLKEALAAFDHLLVAEPANPQLLYNRGMTLSDMERFDEALASFDQALRVVPGFVLAHDNRGVVLQKLNRFDEALAAFDMALQFAPEDSTLCHRAETLRTMGRTEEALACFDQIWFAGTGDAAACLGRGETLRTRGRMDEALECYDRALALGPDTPCALNNRGTVLEHLHRFADALQSYDRALTAAPDYLPALYNRGLLYWLHHKRLDAALVDMERAFALEPDYNYLRGDLLHLRMQAGDWRGLDEQIAKIDDGVRAGRRVVQPFAYQAISQSPADLQACATIRTADLFPAVAAPASYSHRHDKIRLGYVSGEFRQQATALLTAGLYESHDKSRFELVGFDNGQDDGSALRTRLKAGFGKFIAIAGLSDDDAAARIRAEEIDILINLNGYFGEHRMGVFARRPAPIQVNYLGFPGTLGAPYMDYIIADKTVIPEEDKQFFTEQVVWLPDTYQATDSRRAIADAAPSRSSEGLPDDAFVFCNFNASYKLMPQLFTVWMNILRQTPNSVLWLLKADDRFVENIRREAAARDVAPERVVFAPTISPDLHLARLTLADLFIDTLPYNAHTTASDALWAGVPLVTCRGQAFAGRVAASLLDAIGLPQLITDNLPDYEALVLKLAHDPVLLAGIRQSLVRDRATRPLFDTGLFCRNLEAAYTRMWETWQHGECPAAFRVEMPMH